MLVLILIDAQCSQNAVFSFENFSNRQNHPSQKSTPKSNRELTKKNNQKQARFNREKSRKIH